MKKSAGVGFAPGWPHDPLLIGGRCCDRSHGAWQNRGCDFAAGLKPDADGSP